MIGNQNIPVYNLKASYDINIEFISHINKYDFTQFHRHNYYEILFFKKGGGYQIIDFEKLPIKDNSCYMVKPGQVHLVKRDWDADGLLIQFTDKMILPDVSLTELSTLKPQAQSAIIYEGHQEYMALFIEFIKQIEDEQSSKSTFFKEKSIHILSNLLYSLEELGASKPYSNGIGNKAVNAFAKLVETHLKAWSVNQYARALHMPIKKLEQLVKTQYGITPLKYIHSILILNIKRDLLLGELSYKEIAFRYHFDSPSNFSLFIKKHTGLTPTQLQNELIDLF